MRCKCCVYEKLAWHTKSAPELLEEGLGCVCVSGGSIQLQQRQAALGNGGDVVHLQCLQVL